MRLSVQIITDILILYYPLSIISMTICSHIIFYILLAFYVVFFSSSICKGLVNIVKVFVVTPHEMCEILVIIFWDDFYWPIHKSIKLE